MITALTSFKISLKDGIIVGTMPIRLTQARLIPQGSRHHGPDHNHRTGIRTPLGGSPDTLQMAGAGRPHQRKDAENRYEGNLTCAGSYSRAPTCVNRIGIRINYIPWPDPSLAQPRAYSGTKKCLDNQVSIIY